MSEIAVLTTELEHVLSKALQDEWIAQGHEMNGAIIKNIEYVVKQETNTLTLTGMMNHYGNIIAAGTKKEKIPFSPPTGRGGTSLYIQALQNYVKLRMRISDEKKSLGVAFAIAQTQKREGMPTRGSYNFTSTGKRLDWVEEAFKNNEELILKTIQEMTWKLISVDFDVLLTKWQSEINKA